MLFAPIPHSLRSDSLVRPDDAINGMPLEQLRTGIHKGCLFGRLAASSVALIDFTMHHPFRHCPSRAPHKADAVLHSRSQKPRSLCPINATGAELFPYSDARSPRSPSPFLTTVCAFERRSADNERPTLAWRVVNLPFVPRRT